MTSGVGRLCELCNAHASTFCPSDEAFLCWSCDANVHQANFLVARHVRLTICSKCKAFTGNPVFDFLQSVSVSFCAACSLDSSQNDHLGSLPSSSESDCVSSTLSCATSQRKNDADPRSDSRFNFSQGCGEVTSRHRRSSRRNTTSIMDWKAEGVLVYWCMRLGLTGDRAVSLGKNALATCWNQMSVLPFRVSLAATLWFGLKFCGDRSLHTCQTLKRLEEISGVQAKLISAAESKLERALKIAASRRQRLRNDHQLEEGNAESECSS